MSVLLTFPLFFAIIFSGHCYITTNIELSCLEKCLPGYYKTGTCGVSSDGKINLNCKKCEAGTYTDIKNTSPKCIRCYTCGHLEVEIKPCTFNSNRICDCMENYYNEDPSTRPNSLNCRMCTPNMSEKGTTDYKKKCGKRTGCQSTECLSDPECQNNCTTTTSSTTILMNKTSAGATRKTPSNASTSNPTVDRVIPSYNEIFWLVVVAGIFALLFGLLLLRNVFKNADVKQCTEDPKINEQHSHQGSTSDTLTLNISEETPMMNQSQLPEHQASNRTLLPNTEHRAARQDEQSKAWPAIVLYAIIKEVPLRRWKEFLRLLSVADEELERVELDAGLCLSSMERQYQMLRIWSQRSSASLNDVFSALHYMDLTRCAQLLQDNLDNMQWKAESKQDPTASEKYTDHGFSEAMHNS